MKKPEYLQGEAKTFLELIKFVIESETLLIVIKDVVNFYSEPFTKDMIIEPEKLQIGHQWMPLFKGEWGISSNDVCVTIKGSMIWILMESITTVDDFIREAKRAGIKIEWT